MIRPTGLKKESYADVFYLWAAFLAVLALGLVAFSAVAFSQTPNRAAKGDLGQCQHIDTVQKTLTSKLPDRMVIRLSYGDTLTFMVRFNLVPPVSQHYADEVIIVKSAPTRRAFVGLFDKGCQKQILAVPISMLNMLLDGLGPVLNKVRGTNV